MARAVDSSQFDGNVGLAIGRMSVWPSTCSAQSISLGISFPSSMMAAASWSMAARPFRRQLVGARREQHLGFEHEAVADDADVLAVLQELAQAAEEVRAIALQLLHLPGQRRVEARAQILDARLALGVLLLGGLQRLVQGGDLPAQRQQLLVEQVDLGQRLVGDLLLVLELAR